jgi:peroxiredoxin
MGYANTYSRLQAMGGELMAISVDAPDTLKQLKERLQLPFRLLSDADFSVARRYGVYESDETDEGTQPHGEPAVFLLDIDGKIAYSQLQSGPKGHANAAELVLIVLYMANNKGRYWN